MKKIPVPFYVGSLIRAKYEIEYPIRPAWAKIIPKLDYFQKGEQKIRYFDKEDSFSLVLCHDKSSIRIYNDNQFYVIESRNYECWELVS